MARRELTVATDVTSDGWENATFPSVCETCLGDNPYIRMIRSTAGKECKICGRPHTSFRWQPGRKARHKTTIICQTCAKVKNVCQVCLFDLEYGLPVEVRDKFLEEAHRFELPESQVNRDYALNRVRQSASGDSDVLPYGRHPNAHPMLLKLARTQPYYKRNQARVCTFWKRGECTRGDECPYRHEVDKDHDPNLADQNIRDRFLGVNDPVAHKILQRLETPKTEEPSLGMEATLQTPIAQGFGAPLPYAVPVRALSSLCPSGLNSAPTGSSSSSSSGGPTSVPGNSEHSAPSAP